MAKPTARQVDSEASITLMSGAAARDGELRLADGVIRYREFGASDAPAVILLHGLGGHARSWDSVAADLAGAHRVLVPDQRGHGTSDWFPTYSFELMVSDTLALADLVGLERFALIGHSMGGTVAYALAVAHPTRLTHLISVDTVPPAPNPNLAVPAGGHPIFPDFTTVMATARQRFPRAQEADVEAFMRHATRMTETGTYTFRHDPAVAPPIMQQLREPDPNWWDGLPEISAPTLVLRAEFSPMPLSEFDKVVSRIPHARLLYVAATGHMVPLENPSGLVQALRNFLVPAPHPR